MTTNIKANFHSLIADSMQELVIVIENNDKIIYANNICKSLTGYHESIFELEPEQLFVENVKNTTHREITLNSIDQITIPCQIVCIKQLNQQQTLYILEDITRYKLLTQELSKQDSTQEKDIAEQSSHLKKLYKVSGTEFSSIEKTFAAYLEVGREILEMETAIVSKFNGNIYHVLAIQSPLNLQVGSTFEINDTYCKLVFQKSCTVAKNNIGQDNVLRGHPVYINLKLESYLGIPIYVNGCLFGTLSFSSAKIREHDFTWREIEVIELLAESLAKEIALNEAKIKQQWAETNLMNHQHRIEGILYSIQDGIICVDSAGLVQFTNPTGREIINSNNQEQVIAIDDCIKFFYEDTLIPLSRLAKKVIAEKECKKFFHNTYLINSQHEQRDVELVINPLANSDGEVLHASINIHDITELKQLKEDLLKQATHDSLTGLPNRLLLQEKLTAVYYQAVRYEKTFAVLFLDLDNFKVINDQYGHDIGDQVLIIVANKVASRLRKTDTISRIGGDEFVLILSEINHQNDVHIVAQSLLKIIGEPIAINDDTFHVHTSLGISIFPNNGSTPEALIKAADEAMYQAKRKGKNCYMISSTTRHENTPETQI